MSLPCRSLRVRPWPGAMHRSIDLAAPLLTAPLLAVTVLVAPALAGPRICDRPEGGLPAHVRAAMDLPDGPIVTPHGYENLLRLVRENRKALAEGRIDPSQSKRLGGVAITGTKKFPVFPYLYDNSGAAPFTRGVIEDQLFTGPWTTGTMKEYFEEISYGNFSVDGTVDDWFTLANDDDYYEGTNNGLDPGTDRTDEIMIEILDARDGAIDFSVWDNDGPDGNPNTADDDGYVDFIMFLTPDASGSCGGNDNVWSHAWQMAGWTGSFYETDDNSNAPGVSKTRINNYFISAGLDCDGVTQRGIGTHCHEFGHTLGIKDLYDTDSDNGASAGIGYWGLMASGNNNTQAHPAHMTAWSKERLGWLSYFNVNQKATRLCLPPVENNAVAVRLWTEGAMTDEYFVVENRQRIGFDVDLLGTGLVIYHIDEDVYDTNASSNAVNADETRKAIDVECADASSAGHVANADDLDANSNKGDSGDPWCPDTQTDFTGSSIPDSRAYSGSATDVSVTNIETCGPDEICADYSVGLAFNANVCMHDCAGDGCAEITTCSAWWGSPDIWIDNDDDGVSDHPADGVDNHLWVRVENVGPSMLANVNVDLYYGDPAMGQLWPSTGTLIGTAEMPILGLGEVAEDFVVFNYPDPPELVDHYCIGAIVRHTQDPQNSEYPPNDNNVAQVNHQVLIARAGGSSPSERVTLACPGSFDKKSRIFLRDGFNPQGGPVHVEVRLGTPPTFADWSIPPNWSFLIDPHMGPFTLGPGSPDSIVAVMSSPDADHGQTAHVPLTLWDLELRRPVGGVILDYEIDCLEPRAPQGEAMWLPSIPDHPVGPTVLVEWLAVQFDVGGGGERIKYYEVYRRDDLPTPETLVDVVAIDAEPGTPGFQWYDHLTKTCDITYFYRVIAIDAADNRSAPSAEMVLQCAPLTVGEDATGGPLRGVAGLHGLPNPFSPQTAIRYVVTHEGPVTLEVFDASGRPVRVLVDAERPVGAHEAVWDGTDENGRPLPSGVYFARIRVPGGSQTRQLVLAR